MALAGTNDLRRHTAALDAEIQGALARVARSGRFVLGAEVEAFEREFGQYCGARHCIAVASGTDALELALRCLGVRPGQRVLTVANAGMYSTCAIRLVGAEPAFVDIDPRNLLMDPERLREALGSVPNVNAVIVTHLYGLVGNIAAMVEMAHSFGASVIEDCAQSHGASVDGRRAGTFADLGCFSFYPTKNLGALGDAGAVTTDREDLAQSVRRLRQYGWSEKYHAVEPGGRNSRLDEMQAAVLRTKLTRLDDWNARRRSIAARYSTEIANPRVTCPAARTTDDYVAHLYVVRSAMRDGLRAHLAARHVPSDIHYPFPDYKQPAVADLFRDVVNRHAEAACREVLTLPCFPEMTDDEVSMVVAAVNEWVD